MRSIQSKTSVFAQQAIATVERSRETIEEKAIAALDAVYHTLSEHLVESYDFFTQREQDLVNVHDTLVRSLVDQELEWKSTDGKHSGKTMLGVRMKKFQKTIDEEEKEFKHQYDEWTRVQDDFRQIASYIVGPDGLDNLMAGKFDPDCFVDAERAQMMEEIEAEKRSFMEQIEMAGREAIEAMTESEKVNSSLLFLLYYRMLTILVSNRNWSSSRRRTRSAFWLF